MSLQFISQAIAIGKDVDLGNITGTGTFQTVTTSNTSQIGGSLISTIITSITVVGGLAFVLYFTLSALKWVISGGDKTKVAEAQAGMTQGAIGLIAIVASYFIIGIIGSVLGLDILNPFNILFSQNAPVTKGGPGGNYLGTGTYLNTIE